MEKCKCVKCNYEWMPRIKNPKACPMCKQYTWKDKKNDEVK